MIKTLVALVACSLPLCAQISPCQTNLLVNGDFTGILPVWPVTGNVTAMFATVTVDAVNNSRCLWLVPNNSGVYGVVAPAPVNLGAERYELSMDIMRDPYAWMQIDAGITSNGVRTSIGTAIYGGWAVASGVRVRVVFRFTPSSPGPYLLDIGFTSSINQNFFIDNIVLHPARNLTFDIVQDLRQPGLNDFEIRGGPNQWVAVFMAFGSTGPVTIPGCTGNVLIGPLPNVYEYVSLVSTGLAGTYAHRLDIPAFAAGFALHWQPVAITPGCELGCGDMTGF